MIIINGYYAKTNACSPCNPCLGLFLPCIQFKHFVTDKLTNFLKQDDYTNLEMSSFFKYS